MNVRLFSVFSALITLGGCVSPPCPTGSEMTSSGRCVTIEADADVHDPGSDAGQDAEPFSPDADCVPTGEVDRPDPLHRDDDCDGLDGVWADSVFVSARYGDDTADGLAPQGPVATIAKGLEVAASNAREVVVVDQGTYREQLTLVGGASIYGGYDASMDWARTGGATELSGPSPVIEGVELTEVTLAEMQIAADDAAAGESSVAVRLVRSTGVALVDLDIEAGSGGDGANGAAAAAGGSGRDGSRGWAAVMSGSCPGPTSSSPPMVGFGAVPSSECTSCAAGGDGGAAGTFEAETDPDDGERGALASAVSVAGTPICPAHVGVAGGSAGTASSRNGRDGRDGAAGMRGRGGAGAAPGVFSAAGFALGRGGRGAAGTSGDGGSGGGGGQGCAAPSFCFVSGGSGGGGGSGGCGGEGGEGATGGGASVALWLWATDAQLEAVTLTARDGGAGGAGGNGGAGGAGGAGNAGGFGTTFDGCTSGRAGRGGDGGAGGRGGRGGGGAGGPTVALLLGDGAAADIDETTSFEVGAGGAGGAGGEAGAAGLAETVLVR